MKTIYKQVRENQNFACQDRWGVWDAAWNEPKAPHERRDNCFDRSIGSIRQTAALSTQVKVQTRKLTGPAHPVQYSFLFIEHSENSNHLASVSIRLSFCSPSIQGIDRFIPAVCERKSAEFWNDKAASITSRRYSLSQIGRYHSSEAWSLTSTSGSFQTIRF